MKPDKDYLDKLRHSAAHLLASAVIELFPGAKPTIGPSIENGFYYDFDNLTVSEDDFAKIEEKMHDIVSGWTKFEKHSISKDDALKEFKDNDYKKELIEEFSKEGKQLTVYQSGEFRDLCRGGHIENPAKELKFFKLLSIAGAYWRGDEKNPMLTRIYGTAFPSQKELDDYLTLLKEAESRNHKKLGQELALFMFHETSPGMPYWLPKGLTIYNKLLNFWREEHKKNNYHEIASPLVNKIDLFKTSGHWDHYKENMFIADMGENEVYGIKPMNCPNAMIVFGSKTRSYKDLPLRLADSDRLHRYERSGTLNGLLRVRSFQQDDSHNFISEDMIESEYKHIFELCEKFYGIFGLEFRYRLGTRPEGFLGDIKTWNKAEAVLKDVLKQSGKQYLILEGDGAFYGPKVDILMKDAIRREWQLGTVQLDFQQPARFNLKYVDKDGTEKTPVCVHNVIYGSLERFIGIMIEHFKGAFPVWLAPVQVKVLPITERSVEYAEGVAESLRDEGIEVELDDRNETLNAKIRDAQNEKVPYMVIIGDKEQKSSSISLRLRNGESKNNVKVEDFVREIKARIKEKSLDL